MKVHIHDIVWMFCSDPKMNDQIKLTASCSKFIASSPPLIENNDSRTTKSVRKWGLLEPHPQRSSGVPNFTSLYSIATHSLPAEAFETKFGSIIPVPPLLSKTDQIPFTLTNYTYITGNRQINGQLLCGFTGLWTDVMTVMQDLSFEVALKAIAENNRPISPAALAGLLSTLLYAHRGSPFFVEPVIAGLDSRGKPFLCGQV